ncbi:hypothetical protein Fot_05199 [Forsythia ovata]|uniref:Uncharacterized protein n=1 Tax=Forsythia ovata TaxID=205694 RepID=A0ABD1WPG2_9LAMI
MEPRSETNIQPESQSLHDDEPQVDIQSQDNGCYVPQSYSHEWDNVDWGDLLDRVGLGPEGEGERLVDEIEELEARGDIGFEQEDILVDLDYEINKGSVPQAELTIDNNVNIDIGFGDLHEGLGCNNDTNYGNSDELDCLDIEDKLPANRRTRDLNLIREWIW